LGARDKGRHAVIEAEDANFAEEIGHRPRDGEGAKRRPAQQAGDEKGKDAAEVAGDHRQRIDQRAARQVSAFVYGRRPVHARETPSIALAANVDSIRSAAAWSAGVSTS